MIVFLATATPRGPFRCLERARALRCRARPCFYRRSASTRPRHRPDRTWRCRPASPGTWQTAAALVVRLDRLGLVESEGHEVAQIDGGASLLGSSTAAPSSVSCASRSMSRVARASTVRAKTLSPPFSTNLRSFSLNTRQAAGGNRSRRSRGSCRAARPWPRL